MSNSSATSSAAVKPRSLEEAALRVFDPHAPRGRDGAAAQRPGIASAAGPLLRRRRDCASNAKRRIGAQRPRLRPMRKRGLTRPISKSRAAYDVLLNYYQEAEVQSESRHCGCSGGNQNNRHSTPARSCGRICSCVTRRSCFSTTTSKSSAEDIDALSRNGGAKGSILPSRRSPRIRPPLIRS